MSVELERETGDRLDGISQDKCCVTCYWDRQSKAICVKSTSKIFLAVAVISAIYVIASAIGLVSHRAMALERISLLVKKTCLGNEVVCSILDSDTRATEELCNMTTSRLSQCVDKIAGCKNESEERQRDVHVQSSRI